MSIITKPFSWLLLMLYQPVENFGFAILLFALVVKLIMLPFQLKSKKSMMRMQSLTPVLKELEKKHGGNQQKYQAEVAKLYQEEKINPMSGCLWTLIPFPILIALYSVVRSPLTHVMGLSESEIATVKSMLGSYGVEITGSTAYQELEMARYIGDHFEELSSAVPGLLNLNFEFLGMNLCDFPKLNFFTQVNWADTSSWVPALCLFLIPFVSAFLTWLTMKVSSASQQGNEQAAGMMKSMNLMMPFMSVYICFIMPAAMGIYWIGNSLFAIIQDLILNKRFQKILDAENAERTARMEARLAEIERKREEAARRKAEGDINDKNTSKRKLDVKNRTKEAERRAAERAAERAAKGLPAEGKKSPSQVGSRKYARGRAYDPDRYGKTEVSDIDTIGEVETAVAETEASAEE